MDENLRLLRKNISAGRLDDRVQVIPVALSDSDGTEEFQLDDVSSASATLSRVSFGEACEARKQYGLAPLTTQVVAKSLDGLMEKENLAPPAVMKIDIEGAEVLMLCGAQQILTKYKPRLAIELHGIECARAVVHLLVERGYHCYGSLARNGVVAYQKVGLAEVKDLRNRYDVHHLFASCDEADVCSLA
jgi:FkbM family methyltransferase